MLKAKKDILGIIVDVDMQSENGKEYLEIKVDPYPNPISYKGQYHYRSGSTKQELKGAALNRFLLRKQGKRWDGVPVPRVTLADLSSSAFAYFRKKAVSSKRLPKEEVSVSNLFEQVVIHKDYGCGIPIQISVYEDQFYIWNKGQLPDDWTVEKLLDKHPSEPYNPDIANTFFRAGYIESWGRGMKKIIDECTNAGLHEPSFDFDANGLMVEFKGKQVVAPEEMYETSVKILELMKDNPQITLPELASIIGVSKRSIERNIQKLQEEKLLKRIGADKGGHREVVE